MKDGWFQQKIQIIKLEFQIYLWLLSVCVSLCMSSSAQSADHFRFSRLTVENGLSQNSVLCVFQDSRGFMWFGTQNGLNRFDGYHFETFVHIPGNPSTLSDSWIHKISEDKNGQLWIATLNGLNRLDPETGHVTRISVFKEMPELRIECLNVDSRNRMWLGTADQGLLVSQLTSPLSFRQLDFFRDQTIWCIIENDRGNLLVGTEHNGVYEIISSTEAILPIRSDSREPLNVFTLLEDSSKHLWAGTRGDGLWLLNREDSVFEKLGAVGDPVVWSLLEDDKGHIWAGTDNSGITIMDSDISVYAVIRKTDAASGLHSDSVYDMYQDPSGMVWIGTLEGGLNTWQRSIFENISLTEQTTIPTNKENVRCLTVDSRNTVWAGSRGGGLYQFDPSCLSFEPFKHNPVLPSQIIWSLMEDKRQELWIGTASGIVIYKPETDHCFIPNGPLSQLGNEDINCFFEDPEEDVWIGTWGGGLWRYNRNTQSIVCYKSIPDSASSISDNRIFTVFKDSENNLWIGTRGGLDLFNQSSGNFEHFRKDGKSGLSHNHVSVIYEDTLKNLWIGTWGGGINIWHYSDRKNNHIQFLQPEGIHPQLSQQIAGIVQDKEGHIWISTDKGLARFTQKNKYLLVFDNNDGLANYDFNPKALCMDSSGKLFFGGINGVTRFNPIDIQQDSFVPPVYITAFYLFNQKAPLSNQFAREQNLVFSYIENYFSFEFSSLDYRSPDKNRYEYMMTGIDTQWNSVSIDNRKATYTNLNPGTYTFSVRGSSGKGMWNPDPVKWNITITPPFWGTLWFRILFFLGISGLLFGIYKRKTYTLKKQKKMLQKVVEEKTEELRKQNQILTQLNEQKNEFLGVVVHDMRNPLYAIGWLIEGQIKALEKTKNSHACSVDHMRVVLDETEKLKSIVNSLLDLSAVETGKLTLNKTWFDLHDILTHMEKMYTIQSKNKHITLAVHSEKNNVYMKGDKVRISEVLDNLVSNAVKYTPPGGYVEVSCKRLEKAVHLMVKDSGPGLTNDDLKTVFNAPGRLSARPTGGESSTGFGLAIVRKIVELHGGCVYAENNTESGCTFSFTIPLETNN